MSSRLICRWSNCAAVLGILCASLLAAAPSANLYAQQYTTANPYGGYDAANVPNPFRTAAASSSTDPNDPDMYDGPHDGGQYDVSPYDGGYDSPDYCGDGGGHVTYQSQNSGGISGWVSAEFLLWQLNGNKLPPLVTASPSTTPLANAGRLDQASTVILSGDDTLNADWRSGFRISGGLWLDNCRNFGIGADYFSLGDSDYNYVSGQDGSTIVARPFFNTQTGDDDAELVSVPNQLDGTATVNSGDDFWGAGITATKCIRCCQDPYSPCGYSRLNFLGGYRHYEYDSSLSIVEDLTVLPGTTTPLVPGTTILVRDTFRTQNEFNGAELGFQGLKRRNWWWCEGLAKVALGRNRRTVVIDGQTVTTVPGGGTTTAAGGLLTSSVTNIGTYRDSEFAAIPEFRLGLGADVTRNVSMWVGYNVIVWGNASRAADTLPPGLEVDPRNLPPVQAGGGDAPEFPGLGGSDLVAHGLDISLMWMW